DDLGECGPAWRVYGGPGARSRKPQGADGGFAMRDRLLVMGFALLAAAVLIPLPAAAQRRAWTPPRTSDGKPDIQGIYTFATITPLQRPHALAGKETLTPEEAAAFESSENKRLNRDLFD